MLLVVIAIIGIFIALLLPAVHNPPRYNGLKPQSHAPAPRGTQHAFAERSPQDERGGGLCAQAGSIMALAVLAGPRRQRRG